MRGEEAGRGPVPIGPILATKGSCVFRRGGILFRVYVSGIIWACVSVQLFGTRLYTATALSCERLCCRHCRRVPTRKLVDVIHDLRETHWAVRWSGSAIRMPYVRLGRVVSDSRRGVFVEQVEPRLPGEIRRFRIAGQTVTLGPLRDNGKQESGPGPSFIDQTWRSFSSLSK